MSANGISELTYKRDRQLSKLEIAEAKRQGRTVTAGGGTYSISGPEDPTKNYYRALNELDITLLPTVYGVNDNSASAIIDNPNLSGLLLGRPWVIPDYILANMVTYFDPARALSGTTVIDQSEENQNGTLVNGVTHDITDAYFTLDGVDQYIRSADLYNLIGNPDTFSAGVWVKPSASGVVLQITNTATPGVSYHFSSLEFVESGGNPVPNFGLWNGTGITKDTGPALSYNTWYHMVITYNGTTLKGYINGAEVASANVTYDSPHDDGETDQYLLFGAATITNMGDGGYLAGDIGEIRVYSDALSADNVNDNYLSTKARYGY